MQSKRKLRGCLIIDTVHLFRLNPWLPELDSSTVQSLSCVQFFATPWTVALQTFLSFTISRSLLMSIESVMLSNYLAL